ncbi:MAG: leucine-rich repeat protein, partial [Ruminococcus sp.]|nr:leucine-rich repeat protein [Ruminococcus sp.]
LTDVKLSDTLTTLGADAFYNCYALKSLHLPDTLVNIGTCAFGFRHDDNADTANGAPSDVLIEGFKLYTVKNSEAYKRAKDDGIEVITGTTEIFGKNISTGFIYTVIGIIAAFILGIIGVFTGKKLKKSKAEKVRAENRKKAAKRRKERQEAENDDTDKEEDSLEDDED